MINRTHLEIIRHVDQSGSLSGTARYLLHCLVQIFRLINRLQEKPLAQRNGHSIGHWDKDTLVVDTKGIRPIFFGSVPHSEQVHVLERIRVIDEGKTLIDEVTITDPVLYTQPIVVERYFTLAPEGTLMLEYECTEAMWIDHEESRGLAPFSF